jgi:cytochrome c oxidase assembly protein subunit 15
MGPGGRTGQVGHAEHAGQSGPPGRTRPGGHRAGDRPAPSESVERPGRWLAAGFLALVGLTYALIVLGALVRANEAGLACPDWPLCFGEIVPRMDVKVAFEWSHRVVAGGVSLIFAGLAFAALRRASTPTGARRGITVAALLLGVQVLLGGLTVWKLLADWTVTSHLMTGNAFAVALLLVACSLRESTLPAVERAPVSAAARLSIAAVAGLLVLQMALGGLISSRFAGMACPEWPTCNGGTWFPSWRGSVGLHLLHRSNGYLLVASLAATAWACGRTIRLRGVTRLALGIGMAQVVVGVANVLLGIPVELTGLHSALAAALVLSVALAVREAWLAPRAVQVAARTG